MKRMIDIETNDVEVTISGTVSSGTMTYEAHKLGSMYIVLVKSNVKWEEEDGNRWKFTIKGQPASGTWIGTTKLSRIIDGVVSRNPDDTGVAIIY